MEPTPEQLRSTIRVAHSSAPGAPPACEECHAPLDAHQRYCVTCGTRRNDVENPTVRYFATAAARRRRPVPSASARPGRIAGSRPTPTLGAALVLALLPLAAGAGVLAGRSGGSTDDKVLAALRDQKPAVVNVGAGAGTTSGSSAGSGATAATKRDTTKAKPLSADAVTATGIGGAAHQVSGYKPTQQKIQQDKALVRKINNDTGKSYIDSQKSLPDQIVVSNDPGAGPTAPQGAGQP
jgi:hypothetical protein